MHPDEQKLILLQVGDQKLLFAEQPKELSRKLGLSWRAVVKLHADGLLSFDPAVVQGLDEGQEAELRFLATFITSDCDTSLLRKLLATLPKPYKYRPDDIYYNWELKRWLPRQSSEASDAAPAPAVEEPAGKDSATAP